MTSIFAKPRPGVIRHIGRCTIIRDLDNPLDAKPPAWVPGLDRSQHAGCGFTFLSAHAGPVEMTVFKGHLIVAERDMPPRVQTITNPEVGA